MTINLIRKLGICSGALVALLLFVSAAQAVSLPNGTAVFETSLASRITSTDTMMTLVSNSAGGETVNGYDCFTIDEGRSDAEYVCGTVSGTTVTALERGISYANGTTTSTLRAHAHRVGADIKKTDFPLIQRMRNILNAGEGLPNPIGYASHPDFSSALGTTIPDITYVAGLIGGGAGVPLPVNIGGTGAVTLPSMLLQGNGTSPITGTSTPTVSAITATSTATSTFAGPILNTYSGTTTFVGNVEVQGNASSTGKTVFNGPVRANATTTLAGSNVNSNAVCINGVCYAFPSVQGVAGTTYVNDGSGNLSFAKPSTVQYSLASTTASTIPQNVTMNSATLNIPANTLTASSTIRATGSYFCNAGGSGGTCHFKLIDTNGTTYFDFSPSPSGSATCSLIYTIFIVANTSSSQSGVLTGGGLCSGAYVDQTIPFATASNWSAANGFQLQYTTTNTLSLTAGSKGFVMTVTP